MLIKINVFVVQWCVKKIRPFLKCSGISGPDGKSAGDSFNNKTCKPLLALSLLSRSTSHHFCCTVFAWLSENEMVIKWKSLQPMLMLSNYFHSFTKLNKYIKTHKSYSNNRTAWIVWNVQHWTLAVLRNKSVTFSSAGFFTKGFEMNRVSFCWHV